MGCCSITRLRRSTRIINDYHDTKDETLVNLRDAQLKKICQLYSNNESFSLLNSKLLKPIKTTKKHNWNKWKHNKTTNLGLNDIENAFINNQLNELYSSLPLYKPHSSCNKFFQGKKNKSNVVLNSNANFKGDTSQSSNNNYLSITSSSIKEAANNYYKSITNNEEQIGLVYNKLNRPMETFALFIEFFYLKIWKSELLLSIYNEIYYVVTIVIDDNRLTQIQIPLQKSSIEDTYIPIRPIDESNTRLDKQSLAIIKYINYDKAKPIHKIDVILSNHYYGTLIDFSKETIYFIINKDSQLKKMQIYQSIYSDYSNKKIANAHLEFIYAIDEKRCYSLSDFETVKDISAIKTVPYIEYLYLNKNENDYNDNCLLSNCKYSSIKEIFNSIVDIKTVDFTEELKQTISNNRLLEILPHISTKYELFEVVKRLSCQVSSFLNEKKLLIIVSLIDLLFSFSTNKEIANDDLFIGNIFKCLLNCYESNPGLNDKTDNFKDKSLLSDKIIHSIEICFNYIEDYSSHQSIFKYALMLLCKFIDETNHILPINFKHNGVTWNNIEQYICSFISNSVILNQFIDIITNDSPSNDIITVSVIKILLLYSKQQNHSFNNHITEKLFVNVTKNYINNSIIINDLLTLYSNYPSKVSIDQLNHLFDIYLKNNLLKAMNDKMIILTKSIINVDMKTKFLSTEDINKLLMLLGKSLEAICSQLKSVEVFKIGNKDSYTLLTYVYSIAKSINDLNMKDDDTLLSIFSHYQLCEKLIKCFYAIIIERDVIYDKNAYEITIDVIKSKTILFRALYNSMKVIQFVLLKAKNSLSKANAQKMLMVMKKCQDKDNALNPEKLKATIINVRYII